MEMEKKQVRILVIVAFIAFLILVDFFAPVRFNYRLGDSSILALSPSYHQDLLEKMGLAKFYSQFGQDKWIIGKIFPGVKDGYFIDIGAGDAVILSNSKALEDLGWKGFAVEPFPTGWDKRKCQLFREVVSGKKGEIIPLKVGGSFGEVSQFINEYNKTVENNKTEEFVTTTIADLLERAKAPGFINYVSLDIDGGEYEVLKAFPFDEYKVGAWTIEHQFEEPKRSNIRKLLEQNGYRLDREQLVDDWFVAR